MRGAVRPVLHLGGCPVATPLASWFDCSHVRGSRRGAAMGLFRRKDPKPKSIFGGNVGRGYGSEPSSSGIDPKALDAGLLAQGEVLTVGQGEASWTSGPNGLPAPWTHLTVRVHLEGVPPYEATRLRASLG